MQISRHWRMNAQRYRLSGVRTVVVPAPAQPATVQAVQQPRTRAAAAR